MIVVEMKKMSFKDKFGNVPKLPHHGQNCPTKIFFYFLNNGEFTKKYTLTVCEKYKTDLQLFHCYFFFSNKHF